MSKKHGFYWSVKEPIQVEKERRMNFVKAGIEEIDSDIKIKVRTFKPTLGHGDKYP